jgi:hypothetical protein
VRLTTSPPSRAESHEIWEPKPPGTLWATQACYGTALPLPLPLPTVKATHLIASFFFILNHITFKERKIHNYGQF